MLSHLMIWKEARQFEIMLGLAVRYTDSPVSINLNDRIHSDSELGFQLRNYIIRNQENYSLSVQIKNLSAFS